MDGTVWRNMFELGAPLAEKILRPVFVYVFLVVGIRLAGKRELAQLNPFDLVVLLTLSNAVQNAIIGDDYSVTGGLLGAAALLAANALVVRFLYGHPKLEEVVEGRTTALIDHGVVDEQSLRKELITRAELEMAAHKQGLGSLDEVERAVLEPDGVISFVTKKPDPETTRHTEIMARLDAIGRMVAGLAAQRAPGAS